MLAKLLKSPLSLTANPRDLATLTMYIKYWFVKSITESFTSFELFFLYVVKSFKKISMDGVISINIDGYELVSFQQTRPSPDSLEYK